MQQEQLSYSETCRQFDISSRDRIESLERIYLTEGREGFTVKRRGRGKQGESAQSSSEKGGGESVGVSAAAAYIECIPKKLARLGFGERAVPAGKAQVIKRLRQAGL